MCIWVGWACVGIGESRLRFDHVAVKDDSWAGATQIDVAGLVEAVDDYASLLAWAF